MNEYEKLIDKINVVSSILDYSIQSLDIANKILKLEFNIK